MVLYILPINRHQLKFIPTISFFKKARAQLVYLFLIPFLLLTCQDKAALKQALIRQTVMESVSLHKRTRIAKCRENSLQEAIERADSLMIQLALSKVDTSSRISRPVKPFRPKIELPVDTTPIRPLFEDSLITPQDTSDLILEL